MFKINLLGDLIILTFGNLVKPKYLSLLKNTKLCTVEIIKHKLGYTT